MRYPLNGWHRAGRETLCFLFGHRWKTSWCRRPDYEALTEMEYTDIPYAQRKGRNPFYHHPSWWTYKCVRCREKTRNERPREVWHYVLRQSIRQMWWETKFHAGYLWSDKKDQPVWKRLVWGPIIVLCGAWKGFWMPADTIPTFLWTVPADIQDWCYEQLGE